MKIQLETTSGAVLAALGVFAGGALLVRTPEPKRVNVNPSASLTPTRPAPVLMPLPHSAAGRVTFADEFDGTTLNTGKWIDSYPDGERTHSNHEQQYYSTNGYMLQGGKLIFIARRQAAGGMPYTSGMVASYGKFSQKYGRFEIRAKFPKGKGLWPAFWLLPTSKAWPPEIDILEFLGHDPTCVYFTNHWRASSGSVPNQQGRLRGPDFSKGFHTFTLVWKPDALIWSVDGVEQFRTREHVPQEPMYLLANLAVGGDWPGFPDKTTPFPAQMEVDYIRAWQL
ncbi:family 16 glycosylhydrolase [Armatimonas sp.]|uniref:glycoside hydrolase family 16 protein n=1 Tax=Armatimonas sp. TaxID=1872638 RepID=UPI00374D3339